ncbi:hypothetical protein BQ8794_10365 [Mesorhizobium prunaredense]|uniref:Uncharacterized protein n=1 Tax=Mesorhizobium prunaredense TaxID=1631249 RepID=A0A1R3UZD1_9HYPH|nr:hypothetical protein BQ8794_10365 [Mesorhizobium prunaredense]
MKQIYIRRYLFRLRDARQLVYSNRKQRDRRSLPSLRHRSP